VILSGITKKECTILTSELHQLENKKKFANNARWLCNGATAAQHVCLFTNKKRHAQHCAAIWATAEQSSFADQVVLWRLHANMLCGRPLASFTFLINVRSSLCPFISVFLSEQSMGQSAIDHSVLTDDPGILCLFYLVLRRIWFFSAGFGRIYIFKFGRDRSRGWIPL